jgi:hypothetical protein
MRFNVETLVFFISCVGWIALVADAANVEKYAITEVME